MIWSLLLLPACGEKDITSVAETEDTSTDTNTDTDTSEETGTDEDGDGFTIEDGDCDDSDPWTNPGRDEEAGDGIDNDCDGRLDEKWSGMTVSLAISGGVSRLVTINSIGNVDSQVSLNNDCVPTYLEHGFDGGWVISNGNSGLAEVSSSGECTLLADFSEDEDNSSLFAVTAHPDGYYIGLRGNGLLRVNRDGSTETLVEWDANDMTEAGDPNPNYQIFAWSMARDIRTNEIGIFGFKGGFATWSPEGGLEIHKQADLENWDGRYAYAGAVKDGGGWYSLVYALETGEISIARFNSEQNDWIDRISWSDVDQGAQEFAFPQGMTINGDHGDYYVTADVATFSSVFRVREADDLIADLYTSDTQPSWTFYGIVSNY